MDQPRRDVGQPRRGPGLVAGAGPSPTGTGDAVLDAATKFAREHGRGRVIHMVRVFRPPVTAGALDKGGKDTASMLSAINEIIAAAHADGTLTALSKKDLNGVDVTVKQ